MMNSTFYLLGRSGLRVSRLCLGTMTFGTEWGIGSDEETSRKVFEKYLSVGGNFIDTADGYNNGQSEKMLGKFMKEMKNRDQLVLATKFTFNSQQGNPNTGGNSRINLMRAVEASLRRLETDHIDLYWMHVWDTFTPVEEVMSSLDALVRSGKVRYIGFSDVPSWYLARAQTLAEFHGWEKICALQLEYSLVERTIELEHIPAAQELGMGLCPWSPLGGGLLTGKYSRSGNWAEGEGRFKSVKNSGNPVHDRFTDRNWTIVDAVVQTAKELGKTPAQIALNWVAHRPGVTSTILGATTVKQLEDNLGALSFQIPEALRAKLDSASKLGRTFPYFFFEDTVQSRVRGGVTVRKG